MCAVSANKINDWARGATSAHLLVHLQQRFAVDFEELHALQEVGGQVQVMLQPSAHLARAPVEHTLRSPNDARHLLRLRLFHRRLLLPLRRSHLLRKAPLFPLLPGILLALARQIDVVAIKTILRVAVLFARQFLGFVVVRRRRSAIIILQNTKSRWCIQTEQRYFD